MITFLLFTHLQIGLQNPVQKPSTPLSQNGSSLIGTQTPAVFPQIVNAKDPGPIQLPPPDHIDAALLKPISASEAAMVAIMKQPSLKVAEANAIAARALVVQAKSGLLPSASITSAYNYVTRLGQLGENGSASSSNSVGTTLSGFSNQLQVKQLLFDFNRTRDSVQQAQLNQKSLFLTLDKDKSDLVFAVKQKYFQTVQSELIANEDLDNLHAQQAQLDLANARFKEGLGPPADVVTANTNVDNSIQTLVLARTTALQNIATLAGLIGVDPRTPIQLETNFAPEIQAMPEMSPLVQTALNQRSDILSAIASVDSAKAGIQFAKKGLAPVLSVTVNASTRGSVNPFSTDTTGASFGISWPISDSGLTAGKVEQAEATEASAVANLSQVQITVISDVSTAYINLQSAIQRISTSEAGLRNAEEGVRLAEGRYKNGIALFIEITQAEAALTTAQTSEATAKGDYQIALAAIDHAIGKPFSAPSK